MFRPGKRDFEQYQICIECFVGGMRNFERYQISIGCFAGGMHDFEQCLVWGALLGTIAFLSSTTFSKSALLRGCTISISTRCVLRCFAKEVRDFEEYQICAGRFLEGRRDSDKYQMRTEFFAGVIRNFQQYQVRIRCFVEECAILSSTRLV